MIRTDTKIDYDRGSEDPPLIMTRVLIHTTDSIDPEPDEIKLEGSISKPEAEWIATTLRAVLGVPAFKAPAGNAIWR